MQLSSAYLTIDGGAKNLDTSWLAGDSMLCCKLLNGRQELRLLCMPIASVHHASFVLDGQQCAYKLLTCQSSAERQPVHCQMHLHT